MKIHGNTLAENVETLKALRNYKPFQYGGRWYVANLNNEGYAFRSSKPIHRKLAKLGQSSAEVVILG